MSIPIRGRDGRMISRQCPNPDCSGELQPDGDGWARCDGLVDPNDASKELEACTEMREVAL